MVLFSLCLSPYYPEKNPCSRGGMETEQVCIFNREQEARLKVCRDR